MSHTNHICGCYFTTVSLGIPERHYLPQVQLKSHTTISPVCFTTQLTQTFHNPNAETLKQVRYTFPLYDGVAVNGYTISYADKKLVGIVKQKDVAKKTYQAAIDRGETAGLLESLPAGVFGVTLGNVPAGSDIVVEITYCGELKHDAAIDGLRYMLPTAIAPRYGTYPGEVVGSSAVANRSISITVDVDMAGSAIRKVQSPSHPIAVSTGALSTTAAAGSDGGAPFMASQASATLTLGSTELAEDFVLQFLIDDLSTPRAILETHPYLPNHRAIMTTLVPKFTLPPSYPEIVFIADQSGSMTGSKNSSLVSALKIFIKSLPVGVRFNICAFGSSYQFLWPKSQAYNEGNVEAAIEFVESFSASYGGTEILAPIKAAFENHLSDLPLEVMLLTDGEIWAEDAVFGYINERIRGSGDSESKEKIVDARVFALGIGGDVSHTLVEGVARAGNGFAQFVAGSEETDQKVVRMLKGALYGHTKDYELEVHYAADQEKEEMSEEEEDFEIVEKVNECLKIDDMVTEPQPANANMEQAVKKVKSFFDTDAKVDEPANVVNDTADRYAHLPVIETPKLLQAPSAIPPLFPFNRTTVYLLLGPESAQKPVTSVTLRAKSAEGPLELTIPVNESTNATGVPTIHQLAARKAIQDLEEGRGWLQAATIINSSTGKQDEVMQVKTKYASRFDELIEREAVRLGEKFQVAGKWTSFVACKRHHESDAMDVEKGEAEAEAEQTPAQSRGPWVPTSRTGGFKKRSMGRVVPTRDMSHNMPLTAGADAAYSAPPSSAEFARRAPAVNYIRASAPGGAGAVGSAFGSLSGGAAQARFAAPPPPPPPAMAPGGTLFGSSSNVGGGGPPPPPPMAAPPLMFAPPQQNSPAPSSLQDYQGQLMALEQQNKKRLPMARAAGSEGLSASGEGLWVPAAPHVPDAMEEAEEDDDEDMGYGLFDGPPVPAAAAGPPPPPPTTASAGRSGRTKQTARKSTGGKAPRKQMASAPSAFSPADHNVAVMHTLISLQTFSGAWPWNDDLFEALDIDDFSGDKLEACGGNEEAKATAFAIAFLERFVAGKRDVWEMVVAKARAWLVGQMGGDEKMVEEAITEAGGYF